MSGIDERRKTQDEIDIEKRVGRLTCSECEHFGWQQYNSYDSTTHYNAREEEGWTDDVEFSDASSWHCGTCGNSATFEQEEELNGVVCY